MTQALPCTNFNSSKLIRLLAELTRLDGSESPQIFAERLGQWLDVAGAITLSAALNANTTGLAREQSGAKSVAGAAFDDEFARLRSSLVKSISQSCSPNVGEARIAFPTPKSGTPIEIAASYTPFHRYYLAQQRDMELAVGPLRAKVRALARVSPALKQLAALDSALDEMLSVREGRLLSTIPLLLEKRFDQLLKAHQRILLDTRATDDPALWLQPGGWLAGFRDELQAVLLAELDVRLQPVVGLMEAFGNEGNRHQ